MPQIEAGRIVNPNSALNFGKVSSTADKALLIKTSGATGNLTVTVTGNGFSASTTSITQANANNGYNLIIYFAPTTAGNYNGTLTISGGGLTPEYMYNLVEKINETYKINDRNHIYLTFRYEKNTSWDYAPENYSKKSIRLVTNKTAFL